MSDSFLTISTCTVTAPPRPKSALLGMWPDFERIDEVILRESASTFRPRDTIEPFAIFALFSWFVMPMPMPTPTALSGSGSGVVPGAPGTIGGVL